MTQTRVFVSAVIHSDSTIIDTYMHMIIIVTIM